MTNDEKSTRAEIMERAQAIFAEMGGRATKDGVRQHLTGSLTPDQLRYLAGPGLAKLIGEMFRVPAENGLPQAPEIDAHGTHAQLQLLSVEEYRYVVRKYMEAAGQNRDKAYAFANLCLDTHGVWIEPASEMRVAS